MVVDRASKLKDVFAELSEPSILMIETSSEKVSIVSSKIIKKVSAKRADIVVLSVKKPCKNLLAQYKKSGINDGKMIILCAVCDPKKDTAIETSKVTHISGGNTSLTEMAIALTNSIRGLKGKTFFYVDTISSLFIHNSHRSVVRFIHSMLVKLQARDMGAILILNVDDVDKESRSQLVELCDNVIRI